MSSFEDYKDEILSDVLEHARYNAGNFETLDDFRSDCFICDAVTGNASGSYYCNSYKAAEKIGNLIYSDELLELFKEFGYDSVPLSEGAEFIDVSIRCFLLDEVISEHEDEIKEILKLED